METQTITINSQKARWNNRVLAGIVVTTSLFAWSVAAWTDPPSSSGTDVLAAFCMPPPPDAVVPDGVKADRLVDADVPVAAVKGPTLEAAQSLGVHKGDVVEFHVRSPVPGGLAVHGLTDLIRLDKNGFAVVRLKAIYEGRFPLHFHGLDGSHMEIYVLEVR